MKTLLISLAVGASLSGCAAQISDDPWADLDTEVPAATRPLDCGGFPIPDVVKQDSITYGADGVRALDIYRECSEGNQELAGHVADQVDSLNYANGALVEAGRAQYRIAEMRLEILEEERRHMLWERLQYWVVIGALAFAL